MMLSSDIKAQNVQFSVAIDVRNGITGSDPTDNKPALDLLLGYQMIDKNGMVVGLFYESFKEIEFTKYGFTLGYQVDVSERFKIIPDVEFGMIIRKDFDGFEGKGSFFTIGGNATFQYDISEHFALSMKTNISKRTDLDYMYGGDNWILSNFAVLTYKIFLNN